MTMTIRNLSLGLVAVILIVLLYFVLNINDRGLNEQHLEVGQSILLDDNKPVTNKISGNKIGAVSDQNIINNMSHDEYESSFGPLASSLRDTYIPIHFVVGSGGQLVITRSIKTLIEYFLSANTEEPIEVIQGRIEEVYDRNLNEPANSQAKAVLAQYFEYKAALIDVEAQLAENQKQSMQSADYQKILAERRETRQTQLSQEVYDAFYLKEDRQDNYTAAMLAVNRNPDLTLDEKHQQALDLISLLPLEEQVHKASEHQKQALQYAVSEARDLGASDEEIYQMRTQVYDGTAAERFAQRDEEQQLWDRRFLEYRQLSQAILAGEGLSVMDKNEEIAELQKHLFSEGEQRRLPTLDRMADSRL